VSLDALWAVLDAEVTRVTQVQTNNHACLCVTPVDFPKGSTVSNNEMNELCSSATCEVGTSDTPAKNARFQLEPALSQGCTLVTSVTSEKTNNECLAAKEPPLHHQVEPTRTNRLFIENGKWLAGSARLAAKRYHTHHFNCISCIAAAKGARYGDRCSVGLKLWKAYLQEVVETSE
jgi:hypothetical protein